MDKAAMKAIVKANKGAGSGGSASALAPAPLPRYGAGARASGRASCLSTAPHQGPPSRATQRYAVPTGSPWATSATPSHTSTRGQGRDCRTNTGRGGRGRQPPVPMSNRDLLEWERHNRQLEELQQTYKMAPGAPTCDNCTRASRNPHHDFKQCAFSVCRICKLGGHRANRCPS